MKLLVDAHSFDGNIAQGVTTYIEGLYKELIKIAPEIEVYFAACDIENLRRIFGIHKNVKYIKYKSHNKYARLIYELPAIIRRYHIDAAHYQYTTPLVKCCKEIVTIHDVLFLDYPEYFPASYYYSKKLLFRRSARRADLLLTVSDYSRKRLEFHFHPKKHIEITPNAVDDHFGDISVDEARKIIGSQVDKYILYVSRIEPRKNHVSLMRAYWELKLNERGYHLVFIGKTSIPVPELQAYYNNLPMAVKSKVLFFEQKSYEELRAWYKCAALFVYPSIAEGFGIPPLEAAVAQVPCVCSDNTAMCDFKFFGKGLYNPNDEQRLQELIEEALKPEFTAPNRIQAICDSVCEKYNWETIAQDFSRRLSEGFYQFF